jgi:hypothetical protein
MFGRKSPVFTGRLTEAVNDMPYCVTGSVGRQTALGALGALFVAFKRAGDQAA